MVRWVEETFHPHWRVRLEAARVLHEVKTEHQHLVIFENPTWGTVLMLDGVCQLTTSDEFVYHEMMAHVPLMALARPRRVLVVGGGDGGVLREVLKHPSVEKATLCEIDRAVIDLSLMHYPEIADGCLDDPRADVVIADGLKYVAQTREKFDAIIVDSSEPIGPSAVLHTREFFADCKRALKNGGVLVTQNGLPFLFPSTCGPRPRFSPRCSSAPHPTCAPSPATSAALSRSMRRATMPDLLEVSEATMVRRMAEAGHRRALLHPAVHMAAFALPGYVERTVAEAVGRPPTARKIPAKAVAKAEAR